jgi:hypothetical protein
MSAYGAMDVLITNPRLGHAWRDDLGEPHVTVRLGESALALSLTFGSSAEARAVAAACEAAAVAIEALPPHAQAVPEAGP